MLTLILIGVFLALAAGPVAAARRAQVIRRREIAEQDNREYLYACVTKDRAHEFLIGGTHEKR